MKYLLSTLLFIAFTFGLNAQSDSATVRLSTGEQISFVRKQLINAFVEEDFVSAGLWTDSLQSLGNLEYIGLVWDERWLLYYWTGSYGNLFEEVAQFNEIQRTINDLKNQPQQDSLFELLDITLFEQRFDLFQSIQKAFLNAEEKAFATLLLEYLLRLDHDEAEWAARLDAFTLRYSDSRFSNYINFIKPVIKKPSAHKAGLALDLLLTQGNWRDQLERTLQPSFGADFGIGVWYNRWSYTLRIAITGQKLGRDIENDINDVWPKGEKSTFFTPTFDLGYDIFNTPKLRITPTVGGGFASLRPKMEEDDDGNSVSQYPGFSFNSGQVNTALNIDVKLHDITNAEVFTHSGVGFGAIRLRLGYRWMNLGKRNPILQGNMFFFAIGYSMLIR